LRRYTLRDQHAEAITALRADARRDADERITTAVAEAAAAASLAARDELGEEIARLEATCEALEGRVLAEHEGREEAEDKLGPILDASAAAQKALKTNLELLIAGRGLHSFTFQINLRRSWSLRH